MAPEDRPHGTYIATRLGWEFTITFKDNTVTTYNDMDGKRIYEYSFPKGLGEGAVIQLKNVATGLTYTEPFKYMKEYDGVVFRDVDYYKGKN